MPKNYLSLFLSFCLGLVVTIAIHGTKTYLARQAFHDSNDYILTFNPYRAWQTSKASSTYFYMSLPLAVRNSAEGKFAGHEFISSCEADLIPGGLSEFATGFFRAGKAELYIFKMEHQYKVKTVLKISHLLDLSKTDPKDFVKLQCSPASLVLNSDHFHPAPGAEDLIDDLRRSNRELIQLDSQQQNAGVVIAYDPEDKKFRQVGNTLRSL